MGSLFIQKGYILFEIKLAKHDKRFHRDIKLVDSQNIIKLRLPEGDSCPVSKQIVFDIVSNSPMIIQSLAKANDPLV